MSPIRLFAAGLVAAVAATPALAQSCLRPAEKVAFDVRSLQSQLMVAALICKQDAQYNTFVQQYQGQLAGAWSGMSTYYRRANGAVGARTLDNYVTEMANIQQMDGSRQGTAFCANVASLFSAALAAPKSPEALAQLAIANNLSNPHGRSECSAATPAARSTPERTERRATNIRRVSTQAR